MVAVARGILRILHGIWREVVSNTLHFASLLQTAANIFPLAIDVGINLVRHTPIAFVFGEADVMRSGADPDCLSIPGKWRLPQPEVMPASDHGDGLSLLVTEILRAVEEVKRAHRHCQVVLAFVSRHGSFQNSFPVAGVC